MARVEYWNHNVHYQPVILRAVPPRCGPALDVGCGDGMLACRLAERCTEVTGIDRDDRMMAWAVYHEGNSGAPIKDPDMTWGQVRATASRLLPGVRPPPSPFVALLAPLA